MRIVKGVINLFIGLIAAFFAYHGLSDYFWGNQERFEKYQQLQVEGATAFANLDTAYQSMTIKIKGIETTIYFIDYFFDLEGKNYKGTYYFKHPDSVVSDQVEVSYLPTDPKINATDIEQELADAKKELESKGDLWFGLAGVVSTILLIFFGGIRNILKGLRSV